MTRFTLFVVFCLIVIAPGESRSQDKKADLKFQSYVFEGGGQKVDAELGRLTVPENRKNPNSKLIELAFIRFKSTATNPGPPIVYLAGGPGGSGIGAARGTRFPLFMAMREIGDVIAFDQRATGMSRPSVECTESLGYPLDKPADPDVLIRLYQERARQCVATLKEKGIDVSGYNTNESADDLEDLRKALGVEKISLWGISYGTHLALATIRRHEKSVHRVILAGIEGPAHTWKLPSNIQENLEKISQLVAADPQLNVKIPNLIQSMKTVLDGLEKQPVVVNVVDPRTQQTVGITVGRFDLQQATAQVIGNSEVAGIPALYYALSKGNHDHILVRRLAQAMGRVRQGPIGSVMPAAMDCASGAEPDRLRRIEREAKITLLGSAIDFPFPGVCAGLGNLDLGSGFRAPLRTKVPALFISGTLDARTPVSNAEEVRKGFTTSTHLIIDGAVHSDPLFLSSPKIKDVMLEFMKGAPVSTTRVAATPLRFNPIVDAQQVRSGIEHWNGTLEIGEQKFRLILRVDRSRSEGPVAELVSLDQSNSVVPLDNIQYDGSKVRFEIGLIGARYEGEINGNRSEITGQWTQGGVSRALTFKRS